MKLISPSIGVAPLLLLSTLSLSCSVEKIAPCDEDPSLMVIINGRLIDGSGGAPIDDAIVVVRGDRIEAVGAAGQISLPSCFTRIDARGGTVLPGLFDAHVHISRLVEKDASILDSWLRAGVTSLVDSGSLLSGEDLRAATVQSGRVVPRVFATGPILTAPGGYPFADEGSSALEIGPGADPAPIIASLVEAGSDLIKVSIETGFQTDYDEPGWPVLERQQLESIARAAHELGVPVTAHVTQVHEMEVGLDSGLDGFAHTPIQRLPDTLLERTSSRRAILITSLSVWSDTDHLSAVCHNLLAQLAQGGLVALGTDGPAFQSPGLPSEEIARMSECGMTPMQILVAATSSAARYAGAGGELGTIAPGFRADLVVIDGDPLADLGALSRIRGVIVDGKLVPNDRQTQ